MSGESVNARDLGRSARELLAREADAFVNGEDLKDDVLKLGEETIRAILFTKLIAYVPIPESYPGAPAEYMAERQEIIVAREDQISIVFKARAQHNERVGRVEDKVLGFLSNLGGGLLSLGASAVMGVIKGGL